MLHTTAYFLRLFSSQTITDSEKIADGDLLKTPLFRRYIVFAFSLVLGVACGIAIVHDTNRASSHHGGNLFNYAEYESIVKQMPRRQVETFLGRGTKVAESKSAIALVFGDSKKGAINRQTTTTLGTR